jgi:tetratricopeptide (TPR) repeat protein
MDPGFDDRSRDSIALDWQPCRDFSMLRARKRELLAEQRSRWEEGRPLPPEELLGRWPTDPDIDPDAASLLLEDYLQRQRGEELSLAEYVQRFPDQKRSLEGLLARETVFLSLRRTSSGRGCSLRLPDVGDEVFGFRLRLALGQGAFGRVFLSEQADLAGRPVVLKVTAIEGDEPQTLAQLLHTHIVPIYSLHEDQRAGLRAVCMPYLGGASLSAVLTKLWTESSRPVSDEQLMLALESVEAPRPSTIRGSLGILLAEMLTGRRPFDESGSNSALPLQIEAMALERSNSVPSIRNERPDISWGLESIARKCLAAEPARRYQQAAHLADDLCRLLKDRPLKHAPELSRMEQARKLIRRHPRLASSGTVAGIAAVVILAVGFVLAGVHNQLADTRAMDQVRAHDTGLLRALCLVHTRLELRDHLREGIEACERTLALFGAPEDPAWGRHATWLLIAPEDRRRLAEDRRELLLLLAEGRVSLAHESRDSAGQALVLLDRAESIPGLPPSRSLWLDRARYYALRGEAERADSARRSALETPATTARDHYPLASSIACQGGPEALKAAITELDEALRQNPRHYWSLVQRGICRLERGELVEAAADFGQCTGIWPEFVWGYFNRGCVLDRTGNKADARHEPGQERRGDPGLQPGASGRPWPRRGPPLPRGRPRPPGRVGTRHAGG